ncbi:MAG TPA: M24 family metallopeptidase [Actinomycetota bacterium]|nr:M24 family metallopeptidase [Actinomycetota bacterium]
MYFPQDEYEERWRRIYDAMEVKGIATALVWGRTAGTYERHGDLLYLTNYYSSQSGHDYDTDWWTGLGFSAVLMHERDVPLLVADEPDYPSELLPIAVERVVWGENVLVTVAEVLKARGITEGRVALVGEDFLPAKYYRLLTEALPGVEFVADDRLVRDVRLHKTQRELDCYREAGVAVSAAMTALMERAVRGGTQAEAAAAGASELVRRGGFPHMVPVASGNDMYHFAGDPITGSSPAISMSDGDMVRAWVYGPAWQGYWCDPGRTAVVGGKPRPDQRALIGAANDIVSRVMEAIRPGVRVKDIVNLGSQLRREAGTEDDQAARMFPLYGHGIGLYWEEPYFTEGWKNEVTAFHEGQTVTAETFLYRPGVGSAGVEQNFIVGRERNELLTTTELEWW